MTKHEYDEAAFDQLYSDALKRGATWKGRRVGLATIFDMAQAGGYTPAATTTSAPISTPKKHFDLRSAVPVYHSLGMSPRDFAGPTVGTAYLWPLGAVSALVALGGVGKSSLVVNITAHIAAGKKWGEMALKQRKCLLFCVEENKQEIDRKFGACVHLWSDAERQAAADNLRVFSCLGGDPRLTAITNRQVSGTDMTAAIIAVAQEFRAEVIILDHLQGFTSGDLNQSDTATALAAEANKIVEATGAAVVFTAHTSKQNINAEDITDGFLVGSLAFENACRQVAGIVAVSAERAKTLDLDNSARDYLLLAMPKNSYGQARQESYLKKVYVPDFHTVRVEAYSPNFRIAPATKAERLDNALVDYLRANPGTTKNKIDRMAGRGKQFKATRAEIEDALDRIQDSGRVRKKKPSPVERKRLRLTPQVGQIYEVSEPLGLPPNTPSVNMSADDEGDPDLFENLSKYQKLTPTIQLPSGEQKPPGSETTKKT